MPEILYYFFGKTKYTLMHVPSDGATLLIKWDAYFLHKKIWANFVFDDAGSITVTTAEIPRYFDAYTIRMAQDHFKKLMQFRNGKTPFQVLKAHFDARQLAQRQGS